MAELYWEDLDELVERDPLLLRDRAWSEIKKLRDRIAAIEHGCGADAESAHPRRSDPTPTSDSGESPVRGETWTNSYITPGFAAPALVVEPTDPGDEFAQAWLADEQNEPGVRLSRAQCHTLALSLMARALIMGDGPRD